MSYKIKEVHIILKDNDSGNCQMHVVLDPPLPEDYDLKVNNQPCWILAQAFISAVYDSYETNTYVNDSGLDFNNRGGGETLQ